MGQKVVKLSVSLRSYLTQNIQPFQEPNDLFSTTTLGGFWLTGQFAKPPLFLTVVWHCFATPVRVNQIKKQFKKPPTTRLTLKRHHSFRCLFSESLHRFPFERKFNVSSLHNIIINLFSVCCPVVPGRCHVFS